MLGGILKVFKVFKGGRGLIFKVLKSERGLTYIDLVAGVSVLMIAISFLATGISFSNNTSSNTRAIMNMGGIANDVAEFLRSGITTTQAIDRIDLGKIRGGDRYNIDINTSFAGITSSAGIGSGNELMRYEIVVGYIGDDGERDNEDDSQYRLTLFIADRDSQM